MSSANVATVIEMIKSLPEDVQEQVIAHLREYIADLQDELQWHHLFKNTQSQLIAAAKRAKEEIAQGKSKPFDYEQL